MAQLVLEGISPAIFQEIERRARQAGKSVQAEASWLLEEALARIPLPSENGIAGMEGSAPPLPSLGHLQASLAAQYPEEYVVLRGDRVLAHTLDKAEAFACYEDALEQTGNEEPLIVPPAAYRQLPRPVVRGRALASARRP